MENVSCRIVDVVHCRRGGGILAGLLPLSRIWRAVLASWGLVDAYASAQGLLGAQIFLAMLLASFTPLPDKIFIYAAGILGSPFLPFILCFSMGRGGRMSVVTYLVWKFGAPVLELVNKYSVHAAFGAIAILVAYAMVHWHLFGL